MQPRRSSSAAPGTESSAAISAGALERARTAKIVTSAHEIESFTKESSAGEPIAAASSVKSRPRSRRAKGSAADATVVAWSKLTTAEKRDRDSPLGQMGSEWEEGSRLIATLSPRLAVSTSPC